MCSVAFGYISKLRGMNSTKPVILQFLLSSRKKKNWLWDRTRSVADLVKLFFFAYGEFFRFPFFACKLECLLHTEKSIDCKMT
jgi:hypothetical protein